MKISSWLVGPAVLGALVLGGCAGTGATRPATSQGSWAATGPNSAIITTASKNQPVVKADTKENFQAIVAAIHKQMQPGGRWQYIDKSGRATIDDSFADMAKLYDRFGSVDKMDQAAKVRLLADQSTVNAILTQKDGDRIICKSTLPVGSHLPVKTCQTYAQIQAQQRQSQKSLMHLEQQSNRQKISGH